MIRVRGDGREYNFRLNVPRSVSRNSYRQSFKTKKDEWIEVTLPMEKFVATWRGRVFPNEKFDPSNVTGMGIQLSDKKPGPFKLEVEWIKVGKTLGEMFKVLCEGTYQHHLQGVCTDEKSIYWSFTTTLVKTDMEGTLLKQVPVANHHGDLCFHDGKLYVAVNLGKFNDPEGNADSWVYVYDAETLTGACSTRNAGSLPRSRWNRLSGRPLLRRGRIAGWRRRELRLRVRRRVQVPEEARHQERSHASWDSDSDLRP